MPTRPSQRPPGRPTGTRLALSATKELRLLDVLRNGVGPVNLAETARQYGISRGTLLRYINEEPGLRECIEARRLAEGRGYVPVTRGTRATRKASKERREALAAAPRPQASDPPLPSVVAVALQRELDRMDADQQFFSDDSPAPPSLTNEERIDQIKRLVRRGPLGRSE